MNTTPKPTPLATHIAGLILIALMTTLGAAAGLALAGGRPAPTYGNTQTPTPTQQPNPQTPPMPNSISGSGGNIPR